jgi:hypothetical protein
LKQQTKELEELRKTHDLAADFKGKGQRGWGM